MICCLRVDEIRILRIAKASIVRAKYGVQLNDGKS